mgnify:CR=1 FL=1
MELNDDILDDKIEQFLSGQMNKDEAIDFKQLMEEDYALFERVQKDAKLYEMVSLIASGEVDDEKIKTLQFLDEKIKNLAKSYAPPKKVAKKASLKWAVGIATALLIILALKILYWDKKQHDEIYAAYYEPINNFFSLEKAYTLSDSALVIGFMNLYDSHNYSTFIEKYNQLAQTKNVTPSDKSVLQFYAGVALMEQGQHQKAVGQFQQIQKGDLFYTEAQWYMALSCISEDDIKNAKELLNLLVVGESKYSGYAETILDEL